MKQVILSLLLGIFVSTCFASGIGYALSGGGARGFAHVGILKVLEEEGIQPDYIAGTSIGAIIGAFYALGYNAAEIESLSLNINWESIFDERQSRNDLYIGQKRWAPFGNAEFEIDDAWKMQLPSSVYSGVNLNLELFRAFSIASKQREFRSFPIPFAAIGTDLLNGDPKVFDQGSLMQALRASMSIPSLLLPFAVDGRLYIDGGISQNLPIDLVKQMGATNVIGFKVNSNLRKEEQLYNLISILDQTINIGITRKLNEHIEDCDLLIEPELIGYSANDFKRISSIIKIGEMYARDNIEKIREFVLGCPSTLDNEVHAERSVEEIDRNKTHYYINKIEVHGNRFLSPSKIREYLGIQDYHPYDVNEIISACRNALYSQYFTLLYPELVPSGEGNDGYNLRIHVVERQRKHVAFNISYNNEIKLAASSILTLNNMLLKNSKYIAELKLGGENELNIDYVKNFGERWGVYYRIFPYVNEKTLYVYNEDHYKTNSVKSLEWGATTGLGLFTKYNGIAEFYLYNSNTLLYRGISESEMLPRRYKVSGFGIKAYHESLDDYTFPRVGAKGILKFNFARDPNISDYVYSSVFGQFNGYYPVSQAISIDAGVKFGSYFNSATQDKVDPFKLGGTEGFLGYSRYELSASYFRMLQTGLVYNPIRDLYISSGVQNLAYSDESFLSIRHANEFCFYTGVGIKTIVAPLKFDVALNKRGRVNVLFSIGYDRDIFTFSRK